MKGASRRSFLTRSALAIAASGLPDLSVRDRWAAAEPTGRQPVVDDWEAVRAQFELARDQIHLGGLLLASHPTPVREAIETHRRGLDENPVRYIQENRRQLETDVRRAAAAYLGGDPAHVALTDSTTMGLGLVYNGIDVRAGQEILTTEHDFFATHEAVQFKAARVGATVRKVALYRRLDAVSEEEIVETLGQAIGPQTRVIAVTWVHSSTGLKLPIRAMADAVAQHNAGRAEADRALLCVDGVHGLGVEDARPTDLGCDFFIAGCHKWLFGPRGTGVIWGRPEAWPAVTPTIPSFTYDRTPGGEMTPGGYHSFEHRWALNKAFELHQQIGPARVAARIHELNRQFKDGLSQMGHVTVHTPMADSLSAGLVCFEVRGLSADATINRLRRRGVIATVTPYAIEYARVAPGLLNTPAEVDAALAAIRSLA